jgi:riboflavin synthase
MFSGLIEHTGIVVANEEDAGGRRLVVAAPQAIARGVAVKDSVAIDGVCLTVVSVGSERFAFDVVPETLDRTTLGLLREGDRVNVELSLRFGDRLGGHFVHGHVDATAEILQRRPEGNGERLAVAVPAGLERAIVEKGNVALDGVSLTVAAVREGQFEVALIPETVARTTLGRCRPGDRVNLEIDLVARYVLGASPLAAEDAEIALLCRAGAAGYEPGRIPDTGAS